MQLLRVIRNNILELNIMLESFNVHYKCDIFECIVACQLCKYNTIACTCEIFNSMMLTEMPQFNTVL